MTLFPVLVSVQVGFGEAADVLDHGFAQFERFKDHGVFPVAQDPPDDLLDALDVDLEKKRAVVLIGGSLGFVPRDFIDIGGHFGGEKDFDVKEAVASNHEPGVAEVLVDVEGRLDSETDIQRSTLKKAFDLEGANLGVQLAECNEVPTAMDIDEMVRVKDEVQHLSIIVGIISNFDFDLSGECLLHQQKGIADRGGIGGGLWKNTHAIQQTSAVVAERGGDEAFNFQPSGCGRVGIGNQLPDKRKPHGEENSQRFGMGQRNGRKQGGFPGGVSLGVAVERKNDSGARKHFEVAEHRAARYSHGFRDFVDGSLSTCLKRLD